MNTRSKIFLTLSFLVLLALLSAAISSFAQPAKAASTSPIRYLAGFGTNVLAANDDGSTGVVPIGFTINFFGNQHDTLYVNNNGNITLDSTQSTYTPYDLTSTSREIIAAFFGDVDTRGAGSSVVTYGNAVVDGHQAFGVNYVNVGYYNSASDKLNSFQLILIDRSDISLGDFDIEFNYEKIQWETGTASGGSGGLGGASARVGFSNGTGVAGTFFELPGSAVNGAFLDTNQVSGLIYNSFNTTIAGRYHFEARNGSISTTHNPLIIVPGVGGSIMQNDPNQDGTYDEVWPNATQLIIDPWDSFLQVLKLNSSGTGPYDPNDSAYSTVRVDDIIRTVAYFNDVYTSTINYFTQQRGYQEGVDLFVCPYDWRKHIPDIAAGSLANTLDKCVDNALALNPSKTKVDILAHSMGGLVARAYVSNANRASKVDHLVTLGTPYLGAPEIALAAIDKMCFIDPYGICLTNPDTLHQISQNFPSIYDVAPGDSYFQVYQGYIYRNWDKNGDGTVDGWLTANESYDMLSAYNSGLSAQARSYYGSVGGWTNGGTNGVNVLMIVGSGLPSPSIIWETQESDWWNPNNKRIVYTTKPTSGDGTVPQNSANMRNPQMGTDLSANVSTVYFKLEHGDLAKNTQVLQVAATFFESGQNSPNLARLIQSDNLAAQQGGPSLDPIPLNGQYLIFKGDVTLEVIDEFGNRIGMLSDGQSYEVNIPGASYIPLDHSVSVFLPNDRTYQIYVNGEARTDGFVSIEKYVNDNVDQTTVYEPLVMGDNSSALLNFDPNGAAGSFAMDQDGDGTVDSQVDVAAVLDSQQSTDNIAPQTTISIDGTPSGDGWYVGIITVTISAEDNPGGVGVDRIEYSVDGGQTILEYTGPFNLDASIYQDILARSFDFAGNRSANFARRGHHRIFLPLVIKTDPGCSIAPTLISPPNGSSLNTLIPLYQWSGNNPNVTELDLDVAQDPNFTVWANSLADYSLQDPGSFQFSTNLAPATTYYWRAYWLCGSSKGPYTETRSFTTGFGGTILSAPGLIAPANGSSLPTSTVNFQWSPVSGATEYIVHWREVGFGGYYYTRTTETQFTYSWLSANTVYEWWISAQNNYAVGADSATWQFTTPSSASAAPLDNSNYIYTIENGNVIIEVER